MVVRVLPDLIASDEPKPFGREAKPTVDIRSERSIFKVCLTANIRKMIFPYVVTETGACRL